MVVISVLGAAILVIAGAITGVILMNMSKNSGSAGNGETGASEEAGGSASGSESQSGSEASGNAEESSGASSTSGTATASAVRSDTSEVLPRAMSGQEAIDALGDDIDIVAKRNGMSADELEEMLLKNPSAKVSKNGFILMP